MITQKLLPTGTLRRSGQKILSIKFIVAHDTANDGATALQNVDYYIKTANLESASAHSFVDANGVIECIPQTEKAWHVRYNVPVDNVMYGADANDYAIGVELCYSTKGLFDSKTAYNNYVEYIRGLCVLHKLDPLKSIVGHYKLDPDRRTDPINAFSKIGKTWEDFIKDVSGQEELVNLQVPKSRLLKIQEYLAKI